MRCRKAQEFVSQEMDAVLPPDAAGKLRDHLDGCAECQEYRADMLVGQRILAATVPELPDNFDWKLQLKLKQTLQKTAGEAQYPWTEKLTDRWLWLRNFGAATAVGLAAVLALAMFFGPVGSVDNTAGDSATPSSRLASARGSQSRTQATSDRRPLFKRPDGGLYRTGSPLLVSASGGRSAVNSPSGVNNYWSVGNTNDLRMISQLRSENLQLRNQVLYFKRAMVQMKAQLDKNPVEGLDLQQDLVQED